MDSSVADRAIAAGRLDYAGRVLYDAVARAPRQPSVRGALGAFLAARGKLLVGATLLDEALQFGADTAPIERHQLAVYRWAGLYARAAALHTAPLSSPAREAMRRAMGTRPGGATEDTVLLEPGATGALADLGRVVIAVDGVRADAVVDALTDGVVLPASAEAIRALDRVGSHGDTVFAVARVLAIGTVTVGPVPVVLVGGLDGARIGLDVLSLLTPTFDAARRTMTVRAGPYAARGQRLRLLLTFPGVTLFGREGAQPVTLHSAAGRAALRGKRWTLDIANGAVVIEP